MPPVYNPVSYFSSLFLRYFSIPESGAMSIGVPSRVEA